MLEQVAQINFGISILEINQITIGYNHQSLDLTLKFTLVEVGTEAADQNRFLPS